MTADLGIAEGGEDHPDNLRAVATRCHRWKTAQQARQRAKERRIRSQAGLMRKKPTRRDKRMAGMASWRAMP